MKNKIDISTEEKRKEVYEIFNSLTSKNKVHEYFNISDNKNGSEYIKQIANEIGFDLNVYKERKKKYCLTCGKELKKGQNKFCSSSCSATYNNALREVSEETKKKISESLKKEVCEIIKTKNDVKTHICLNCGKPFKGSEKRKFCSNNCSSVYRKNKMIEQWLNGNYHFNPNYTLPKSIREFLFEKNNYKCELCNFEGYNKKTNLTILQIHHIDGNSENNHISNLQVLCPNCHSMTENYMSLNKGKSGRKKRYEKGE